MIFRAAVVILLGVVAVHAAALPALAQAGGLPAGSPPITATENITPTQLLANPTAWNFQEVARQFWSWAFLGVLGMTLAAGALGGFVYELITLHGMIEKPHWPDAHTEVKQDLPYAIAGQLYDLGIAARVFIGAMAALATLLVVQPQGVFGLLALGVIAGSAGTAVFRALQDRLTATLAQKAAADAYDAIAVMAARVEQLNRQVEALKDALAQQPESARPRKTIGEAEKEAEAAISLSDLDAISALASEAVGIASLFRRASKPE